MPLKITGRGVISVKVSGLRIMGQMDDVMAQPSDSEDIVHLEAETTFWHLRLQGLPLLSQVQFRERFFNRNGNGAINVKVSFLEGMRARVLVLQVELMIRLAVEIIIYWIIQMVTGLVIPDINNFGFGVKTVKVFGSVAIPLGVLVLVVTLLLGNMFSVVLAIMLYH